MGLRCLGKIAVGHLLRNLKETTVLDDLDE